VYIANRSACHGPDGEGDGLLAATLERPPANFTEQHLDVHTDGDLFWWIENGITPVMPAFGNHLDNEEMWHTVNYIRSLRDPELTDGQSQQGSPWHHGPYASVAASARGQHTLTCGGKRFSMPPVA
jgi:mono/diheme cytochrome c family protein